MPLHTSISRKQLLSAMLALRNTETLQTVILKQLSRNSHSETKLLRFLKVPTILSPSTPL